MTRKDIPNLLTGARLVLSGLVYAGLAGAYFDEGYNDGPVWVLGALAVFVVAAVTDYFDGMLARKFEAVSPYGPWRRSRAS